MILVNGIQTNDASALDRGLAYGDGLFETLAVRDGDILNWPQHVERLRRGCDKLKIRRPDFEQLFEETHNVASDYDRSVVKIIITRGAGGRGYTPPAAGVTPTRIVARHMWPNEYREREQTGVHVCIAQHRISVNPDLAGLKHLNRLDQVLASAELMERDADEALMLDPNDHVIEATRCNLFTVRDGLLATPRLDNCGVRGVMRAIILQLAPAVSLRAEETEITLGSLREADEVFLCNAIAGIWPVVEIDDDPRQVFAIGGYTRRLQAALIAGDFHR